MSVVHKTLETIRAQMLNIPVVEKYGKMLEEKSTVNMEYFALGGAAIIAISLFSGFLAEFVSNMIGFLYPTYASIVAIESATKEDDRDLLIYWVVFACFLAAENFVEFVVYWIPFYYPVKVTFLLWCMLPKYKGAEKIYQSFLKPFLSKHFDAIDAALSKSSKEAKETAAAADASEK